MKLEVEVNFDFGNLAKSFPKIIDAYIKGSVGSGLKSYTGIVEKETKEYIKNGRVTPSLAK